MEEDKIVKIEEEIAKDLKDKVKNVYAKDSQKIIETEVRNRKYLAEDWQVGYAVERVQEKIEEIRRQEREIRQKNVALGIKSPPRVKSEEEEFAEKVKGLLGPQEDLFQKALHQEADFYKGIERADYKSVWTFSASVFMDLFIFTVSVLLILFLVHGVVVAIEEKDFSVILPAVFISFIVFLFCVICFKLSLKLIGVFMKRDKDFKRKSILILIIPFIFFATMLAGWMVMMLRSW